MNDRTTAVTIADDNALYIDGRHFGNAVSTVSETNALGVNLARGVSDTSAVTNYNITFTIDGESHDPGRSPALRDRRIRLRDFWRGL